MATKDRDQIVRESFQEGAILEEFAKRAGVSKQTFYALRSDYRKKHPEVDGAQPAESKSPAPKREVHVAGNNKLTTLKQQHADLMQKVQKVEHEIAQAVLSD
jgi:transposase-like protein